MSHKPNAVPVLQEGTVYTIILDNGRKVHDVIYHACVASGKSYFAKGDKTYPAEKVRNHSITGLQSFINIGVATSILPNTGLPLPFISYGLSSLVSLCAGMGMVLNINLQKKKY